MCPGNMVTTTAYVYALCHIPQIPQRSYGITNIQYMFLGLFWYQVYRNWIKNKSSVTFFFRMVFFSA